MGGSLAKGIAAADEEGCAQLVAMWEEMSLWNVAWQKTKGLFDDEDPLSASIREAAEGFGKMAPTDVRLMLFFRLASHMNVGLVPKMTMRHLEEAGAAMSSRAIALLKADDKEFTGNTTEELVAYVMQKVFDDLSKRFKDADAATQADVLESLMSAIKEMPEEQREKLRQELGVDELTEREVRKALVSGALGAAFAVVVEVAGFAAYTFAVKMLAAIVGFFGVTLPFAAYATLTSLMATLANPFIAGPALLGFGWLITRRANRKIKNGLAPVIVAQMIVGAAMEAEPDAFARQFIDAFNTKVEEYRAIGDDYARKSMMEDLFPGVASLA